MPNQTQYFYDADLMQTIEQNAADYVNRETGLTLETCYSLSDIDFYNDVAAEILPREVKCFLDMLICKFNPLEESGNTWATDPET